MTPSLKWAETALKEALLVPNVNSKVVPLLDAKARLERKTQLTEAWVKIILKKAEMRFKDSKKLETICFGVSFLDKNNKFSVLKIFDSQLEINKVYNEMSRFSEQYCLDIKIYVSSTYDFQSDFNFIKNRFFYLVESFCYDEQGYSDGEKREVFQQEYSRDKKIA